MIAIVIVSDINSITTAIYIGNASIIIIISIFSIIISIIILNIL